MASCFEQRSLEFAARLELIKVPIAELSRSIGVPMRERRHEVACRGCRRPRSRHSDFVARLLKHLEARRFEGAPRYLGVDENNRDFFSFIPGEVPADLGIFSESQLSRGTRLLRVFHDATADFAGKGAAEMVCHGDPSPCNYVFAGVPPRL
jgi:hypothetical protein